MMSKEYLDSKKPGVLKSDQYYFGVELRTWNPSLVLFNDITESYTKIGETLQVNKNNIVDVSERLSDIIISLHYNLIKKLELILKELVSMPAGGDLKSNWKYLPLCNVMLGEINSYEPYKQEELVRAEKLFDKYNIRVNQQDRLSNTFVLRIKVYDYISKDGLVDVNGLKLHICHCIEKNVLNVIDEMREENTYQPSNKVCDIIDTIQTHHCLKKETVETVLPCRIGELEKLGIQV